MTVESGYISEEEIHHREREKRYVLHSIMDETKKELGTLISITWRNGVRQREKTQTKKGEKGNDTTDKRRRSKKGIDVVDNGGNGWMELKRGDTLSDIDTDVPTENRIGKHQKNERNDDDDDDEDEETQGISRSHRERGL